ncbi:MAG: DNA repair protein RecO [Rhodobacteraceae bacterium]|nr:DNA repair protein RecO [Paracoccaceae bacterium]
MEWRDEAIILTVRRHGESAAIVELLTPARGRHAGVVPGGASRRMAPLLQPGAQVQAAWRARLDEHIGTLTVEPLRSRAAILADRRALLALNAVCGLLSFALPEREPHLPVYAATVALLDALAGGADWHAAYLAWELLLLDELGYGLDLTACALTGATADLAWVSPASGRAVSRAAGQPWEGRLLPYPDTAAADPARLNAGLVTTGYFLERRLARALGDRPLPAARLRLIDALARAD